MANGSKKLQVVWDQPAQISDAEWGQMLAAFDTSGLGKACKERLGKLRRKGNKPIRRKDFGPLATMNEMLRKAHSPFRVALLGDMSGRTNRDVAVVRYADGVKRGKVAHQGVTTPTVPPTVIVERITVQTEPELDVFLMIVNSGNGTWPEPCGSRAELELVLKGVRIGVAMMGGHLTLPDIPSKASKTMAEAPKK